MRAVDRPHRSGAGRSVLWDKEGAASRAWRRRVGWLIEALCLVAVSVAMLTLAALLVDVVLDGAKNLSWRFLTSFPSRRPEEAGLYSALVGTLYVMALTAVIAIPLAVGAATYLEEFAPKNWLTTVIEANIANLAGVPSVIYGLLGLGLFVRTFGLGRSILAGALTLSLLVLPLLITASRESLRAVPRSVREGAFALGATRWQVVRYHVLPLATPGILTGTILALSRAIGETAPLITIGALTYIAFLPDGIMDEFTVLPIQIYNWVSRPQEAFHSLAASGILVLLAVLLSMNAVAVVLRQRLRRRIQW